MVYVLDRYYRKIVVYINSTATLAQVKNFVTNKIETKFTTGITNQLGPDITGLVIEHDSRVTEILPGVFEVYPKTFVSGTYSGTQEEFEDKVDTMINNAKSNFKTEILATGATIRAKGFHMHRVAGSSNED